MEIVVPEEFRRLYAENPAVPILKVPAAVLRKRAEPIERVTKRHRQLAEEMIRLMKRANGIGLAAPQVGVSERLIVIAPGDIRPIVLVNPQITASEGSRIGEEGCLSIPGLYGDVERARSITVSALNLEGRKVEYEMDELAARVVQHEVDHLDGVLFIDKVDVATLHWADPVGAGAAE